jgi:4-hydroxy-2-oxoheptanedioate aldolase
MDRPPNKLREKLANGLCVTGTAVFSWSPYVVDVAGYAGLDYLRIDTEHAWRDGSSVENLIRAAVMGNVVPIVRTDKDNPYLVRKALEIGAGGIIVPDVCSVEQAESVIDAAKFPPRGKRDYSGNCWSGGWGASAGRDWIQWSNNEPMIGIMIENVEAMKQIDEIVAVEGIDFVLFGPADYSMSLGLGAPNAQDERVQEALARTVAATHDVRKYISLVVGTDPANIKKCLELGIDMLELGNDLGILRSGWTQALTAVTNSNAMREY